MIDRPDGQFVYKLLTFCFPSISFLLFFFSERHNLVKEFVEELKPREWGWIFDIVLKGQIREVQVEKHTIKILT